MEERRHAHRWHASEAYCSKVVVHVTPPRACAHESFMSMLVKLSWEHHEHAHGGFMSTMLDLNMYYLTHHIDQLSLKWTKNWSQSPTTHHHHKLVYSFNTTTEESYVINSPYIFRKRRLLLQRTWRCTLKGFNDFIAWYRNFNLKFCHTRLHLGFSAKYRTEIVDFSKSRPIH